MDSNDVVVDIRSHVDLGMQVTQTLAAIELESKGLARHLDSLPGINVVRDDVPGHCPHQGNKLRPGPQRRQALLQPEELCPQHMSRIPFDLPHNFDNTDDRIRSHSTAALRIVSRPPCTGPARVANRSCCPVRWISARCCGASTARRQSNTDGPCRQEKRPPGEAIWSWPTRKPRPKPGPRTACGSGTPGLCLLARAIRRCSSAIQCRQWPLALIKHLQRYPRRIHGRRPSGIERQMGNEPVDFVFGHAILQRPPDMPA